MPSQARPAAALLAAAATATVAVTGMRVWHARTPGRSDTQALRLAARLPGASGPAGHGLATAVVDAVTPAAVVGATVALAVLAWVLLRHRPVTVRLRVVGFCLAAPLAARGAEAAIKQLVDRRPPHWGQLPAAMVAHNPMLALSYPSGHVAITTTLALAGLLVLGAARVPAALVAAAMAAAAATIGAVSVSLVVLGFHFASDVLGGATLGIAVALTGALATSLRPPRSRCHPDGPDRGGRDPTSAATTRPAPAGPGPGPARTPRGRA